MNTACGPTKASKLYVLFICGIYEPNTSNSKTFSHLFTPGDEFYALKIEVEEKMTLKKAKSGRKRVLLFCSFAIEVHDFIYSDDLQLKN